MQKKDRNEELEALKSQMDQLKAKLHNTELIAESQIEDIARSYKPKHRYIKAVCGALIGIYICGSWILNVIKNFDTAPLGYICATIILVLVMALSHAALFAGNSYEIKGNHLILCDMIWRKVLDVPVEKIRFIEFMANKHQGARIMFNQYDDFYLRDINYTALVKDILKINPNIEIRKELA